jgi:hypothetical protein
MLLGLDFMPLDQIANMSLNVLRQVKTQDKNLIEPRMDKPLVSFDLGNLFSDKGTHLL